MVQRALPAVWMRGGTSKGLFVRQDDLPAPGEERDALLLRLLGSPDPMQIDGLGGTYSSTSKVMAMSPSRRSGCDVDYLFAQVAIDRPVVDYGGNCGNLTSAVGAYAVDEGLVPAVEPVTTVRLFNQNTGKRVLAHVPVESGRAAVVGEHRIAGVPGTGAKVVNEYLDPAGSVFGRVFPTGRPRDVVGLGSGEAVEVSLVDVTNPLVFVLAADVGVPADAVPDEVNADRVVLQRLEAIRGACAVRLGLVEDAGRAVDVTPGLPKLALVSAPAAYTAVDGTRVAADDLDILARIMSVQRMHHAYAMTGVMCTAAAARLPGTLPHAVARQPGHGPVRLGHPKGIAEADVTVGVGVAGEPVVRAVTVTRTARRLMAGEVYVPVGAAARTGPVAGRSAA